MATSRMLARSISVSSQVNSMSRFARLLFTWMIAHADDWGVMVGEPRRVRALVLPMDDDATDAEVADALDEMEAQELIWRYQSADGVARIQIQEWAWIEFRHGNERIKGSEWTRIRNAVFARDHYACRYCGVKDVPLHCDHVIPLVRGGANDMSNLVTACAACNLSKHDRTPEEWRI